MQELHLMAFEKHMFRHGLDIENIDITYSMAAYTTET